MSRRPLLDGTFPRVTMVSVYMFTCRFVSTCTHPHPFPLFYVFGIVTANHCQPVSVTQGSLDPPGGICSRFPRLIHLPVEMFRSS